MSSRLSQAGRSMMLSRGGKLFTKYRHTMHKNTLNPEDYYWFGWTKEERTAMELLVEKHALKYSNRLTIKCPSLADKRPYLGKKPELTLAFGHAYDTWPYPERDISDTDITDPTLRSKLLAWVVRSKQLGFWQQKFDRYARALCWGGGNLMMDDGEELSITPVNTPGQLFRAWPEFASLVEKKYTQRMAAQKLRSAMPEGWNENKLTQFRHLPYMDEINQVLLTCSVMEADLEHDRLYPS